MAVNFFESLSRDKSIFENSFALLKKQIGLNFMARSKHLCAVLRFTVTL